MISAFIRRHLQANCTSNSTQTDCSSRSIGTQTIDHALEIFSEDQILPRCPIAFLRPCVRCGHASVLRKNPATNEIFVACSAFAKYNCRQTESIQVLNVHNDCVGFVGQLLQGLVLV